MSYLLDQRGLSQMEIASILEVDKSFVSRVASGERDLSTHQLRVLADALGVPLGALLLNASGPFRGKSEEGKRIGDLCAELMQLADNAVAALRAERAAKAAAKRTA